MSSHDTEKRSEPRTIVDRYYSVEFSLRDTAFLFQFKIWNISSKGMCVVVKEDSDLMGHIKEGDTLDLKYFPIDSSRPVDSLKTEIRHITKDETGRFRGHYLVGLSILESTLGSQDPSEESGGVSV